MNAVQNILAVFKYPHRSSSLGRDQGARQRVRSNGQVPVPAGPFVNGQMIQANGGDLLL